MSRPVQAVIICIGDELLSGNTLDTNSHYIANELRGIGIETKQIYTISDEAETIEKTLKESLSLADIIISTGGLGPTKDDKTLEAYSRFFNRKLVFNDEVFAQLKIFLEKRGRAEILDLNRNQAMVLEGAEVLKNEHGTAPCQLIDDNDKLIFCLPGVPFEVKPLIKEKIIPLLKSRFGLHSILTAVVSVVGIPESALSHKIEDWETHLPKSLSLSYLPVGNRIKLRITAKGSTEIELQKQLKIEIQKLKSLLGTSIISEANDRIQDIVKDLLISRKMTISTAESCTGGAISKLLTSVSGSSAYFAGGVCTYSPEMKAKILGVAPSIIEKHTVVSAEVSQAMAKGCQQLFGTDISVSTTGVAGPNTDQYNNSIGLVYYSVRIGEKESTHKLFLPHLEREDFINFVSEKVLQTVVEEVLKS